MDLFCQKCSKPLELHESLLEIDQSIFIDKDNEDILSLVKILQEKLLVAPTTATGATGSSSSSTTTTTTTQNQILAKTESLASIMRQSSAASGNNNNNNNNIHNSSNTISNSSSSNLSATLSSYPSISQSHNDRGGHLTKFKTGLFRKRDPQLAKYHQHHQSQPQLQHLVNNQQQQAVQQQQQQPQQVGQQQPIAINNDNNNNNNSNSSSSVTGTSPSSFGSLSQHRMSVPSSLSSTTSSSSTITTATATTINNNSNSNSNNHHTSQTINPKMMSMIGSSASSSYEGEPIALIQSNERERERERDRKTLKSSSSTSRQSLKNSSSSGMTSPIHNSSSSIPNNNRIIHSPQQKSLSKLKYLRSNSKSQSLASLPKYQSAIELSMSPPGSNIHQHHYQQRIINNNNNSNNSNNNSGVMSPPIQQHYITTPNTPLQQHQYNNNSNNGNSSMTLSSNVVSPIGSPPLINNSNNSNSNNNTTGSLKYHQATSLFRLITELINTDFPMCMECAKLTTGELELETKEIVDEIEAYQCTLDSLHRDSSGYDLAALDKQIAKLEEEERFYFGALERTQRDRTYLSNIANDLARRKEQLDLLEQRYWSSYSEHQRDANRLIDDQASIVTQTGVAIDKLRRLKETNILNDAFHLWYDGHFGTINGLRLGRLQSQPVEWNEINSAWGLAISLLDNLAKRLNYKFKQFKLIPNGSTSKIEDIVNKAVYELYGSSDISLGRLFWYGRFDNGMVSFLQCLKELTDHVKTVHDPDFEVPYTIENGYINRMLIKMQFTDEDTWTKALKYMLTNLKWLLSWVAKNESTQPMNINIKRPASSSSSNAAASNNSQSSSPSSLNQQSNVSTPPSSINSNNNNNNNNFTNNNNSNNNDNVSIDSINNNNNNNSPKQPSSILST